jgi:hypothetical protein
MKSLESLNHKLIKAHILDPENSPLSEKHQDLLDRTISAAKLLDKNPVRKYAVALHRCKFPHISRSQAYNDLNYAERVFDTIFTFNFEFWQTWIMNSIVRNIEAAKKINTPECLQIIAKEHANMIKVLKMIPPKDKDLKRSEITQFLLLMNLGKKQEPINLDELGDIKSITIGELNKILRKWNKENNK